MPPRPLSPARLWRWLFPPGDASRLAWTVSGLAAVISLRLAFYPWGGLAGLDRPLFEPVPFLRFLDQVPSRAVLVAVQLVGVAGGVGAALAGGGRRRQVGFALAWVAYLVLAGLRASRGKIQHNDLLVVVAAVPFLFAAADARRTSPPGRPSWRFGWPLQAATVAMATSYFCTGLRKLENTGVEWVTGDTMSWIMHAGASSRQSVFPGVARFVADHAVVYHLAAAAVVAVELAFPLVLFVRAVRPLFVVAAVGFHAGTWVTLGLDYWNYAALVVLLLVPWPELGASLRGRLAGRAGRAGRLALRR